MTTTENTRARLRPGLVVTVADVFALVPAVQTWYDEMAYGGDLAG